jgi:hypothetical protein
MAKIRTDLGELIICSDQVGTVGGIANCWMIWALRVRPLDIPHVFSIFAGLPVQMKTFFEHSAFLVENVCYFWWCESCTSSTSIQQFEFRAWSSGVRFMSKTTDLKERFMCLLIWFTSCFLVILWASFGELFGCQNLRALVGLEFFPKLGFGFRLMHPIPRVPMKRGCNPLMDDQFSEVEWTSAGNTNRYNGKTWQNTWKKHPQLL